MTLHALCYNVVMRRVIFLLSFLGLAILFVHISISKADSPEFDVPWCSLGTLVPFNGGESLDTTQPPTCAWYFAQRIFDLSPTTQSQVVFVAPAVYHHGQGDYYVISTSSIEDSYDLYLTSIDKNYFDNNGGVNGLFGQLCDPDFGYCTPHGTISSGTLAYVVPIYVVATDDFDIASSALTVMQNSTSSDLIVVGGYNLVPLRASYFNPYVQTDIGDPIREKDFVYDPLGFLCNETSCKLVFYRSKEITYINQGTSTTVPYESDLSVPVIPGIQPNLTSNASTTEYQSGNSGGSTSSSSATSTIPQTASQPPEATTTATSQIVSTPAPTFFNSVGLFFSGVWTSIKTLLHL